MDVSNISVIEEVGKLRHDEGKNRNGTSLVRWDQSCSADSVPNPVNS